MKSFFFSLFGNSLMTIGLNFVVVGVFSIIVENGLSKFEASKGL